MKTKSYISLAALALAAAITGRASSMSFTPNLEEPSWTVVGPVLLENSEGSLIRATFEVLYVDACAYYRIRHDGRCHLVSKCISKSMATETFVCHMPQGNYYFHLNGK